MSRELKEWAMSVKDRDGNTCVICGSADDVQAHHIIPRSAAPEFSYVMANGITLCFACHDLAHKTVIERGLLMTSKTSTEEIEAGGSAYRMRETGESWITIWERIDPLKKYRDSVRLRYFAQRYAMEQGLPFPPIVVSP